MTEGREGYRRKGATAVKRRCGTLRECMRRENGVGSELEDTVGSGQRHGEQGGRTWVYNNGRLGESTEGVRAVLGRALTPSLTLTCPQLVLRSPSGAWEALADLRSLFVPGGQLVTSIANPMCRLPL